MNYICLYTTDTDLAEAFQLYYEGKYRIKRIAEKSDLLKYLGSPECKCQVLIFDSSNPTAQDFHFLDKIKQAFPELKVIISYVYFEEKNFSESLLATHVDAILYKPFDFGEVDRRVQKLIQPTEHSPASDDSVYHHS